MSTKTTPTPKRHIADRRAMFKVADAYAQESLFLISTGLEGLIDENDEVLDQLMKMSTSYNEAAFAQIENLGDVQCACFEAGIMLGLAMGLRLRGFGGAR